MSVIRDITESKRNSTLLQIQNDELLTQKQALEKARSQLRKFNAALERRVNERTIQLADLNEELESFSYSVAHDLKSPLRSINAYSSFILDEQRTQLNDSSLGYLEKIQKASLKMETLIEDLLNLSKVSRREINIREVDLSPMVTEILEGLKRLQPDRQLELIIAEEMPAMADPNLISIALDNLLRNAWKFTSKQEKTIIQVGITRNSDGLVYFVKDNGVGFDKAHVEKMFKAFERFHQETEFEGTGIGLAITKRIIQRHHGQIWAEGEVNNGATFFFTLPEYKPS